MEKDLRRTVYSILFFMIGLLCINAGIFAAEELTLTTYYPAPYGIYQEQNVSERLGIGDFNGDGQFNASDLAVYPSGHASAGSPIPESLTIAGRVGIGTTSPGQELDVNGDIRISGGGHTIEEINWINFVNNESSSYNGLCDDSSGCGSGTGIMWYDRSDGGTPTLFLCGQGSVWGISSVSASSRKFKEDIRPLDFNKDAVLSLETKSFRWKDKALFEEKDDDGRDIGLIAEDVDKLVPELVIYKNGESFGMEYEKLSLYLLEILKGLEKGIEVDYTGNVGIGTTNPGATLDVNGSVSKTSGSFDIKHPNPEKAEQGWHLRHSFVESPTRGDNLYRWEVTVENGKSVINLPDYFKYLNEDPQVWVSAKGHFGQAYGKVNNELTQLIVKADTDGKYNVLAVGTRKDKFAKEWFDELGVEYQVNPKEKNNNN